MRDVLVSVAAAFGGTMLFFGNDYGLIGLIPALISVIGEMKKV